MNIIDRCVSTLGKLLFELGNSLSSRGMRLMLRARRNLTCGGCGWVHESEYEQLTHRCDADNQVRA